MNKKKNNSTIDINKIRREVEYNLSNGFFKEREITEEVLNEYCIEAIKLTEEYLNKLNKLSYVINRNLALTIEKEKKRENDKRNPDLLKKIEKETKSLIDYIKIHRQKNLRSYWYRNDINFYQFCKNANLTKEEYEACKYTYFTGYPIKEVAKLLCKSEETISSQLRSSDEKFYKFFSKIDDEIIKKYLKKLKKQDVKPGNPPKYKGRANAIIDIFNSFYY